MFLVAGVNGAGKSTFTKILTKKYPLLKVIDPDAIANSITGSYQTIDAEQLAAGKAAIAQVRLYIQQQNSFIVESTISGRIYLNYLKQAKEAGFKTILIYVALSSAELSAERVNARIADGGHSIPIEDIKRRYPRSFENLHTHIQACDLTYIYDNSEYYKSIAAYRDGILHRNLMIPGWLQPYL